MERLSALMDDELDEYVIDGELDRIKDDPQRSEAWATYHMIGDVLRGHIDPVPGIEQRVGVMLANEPTVLAPKSWKANRVAQRVVLPLAASVCGIAVVAWLALSSNSVISPASNLASNDVIDSATRLVQQSGASRSEESAADGSEAEDMSEYLMAHQQFSPSTTMQGVVPYVRTVSTGDGAR